MLGNAHLAFGTGCFLITSSLIGHTPGIAELGAVALGSLVPDADHPRSKLGRWLPGISHFIYYLAGGHRGLTHSALWLIPLFFLASWLIQLQADFYYAVVMAFIFGFGSHLVGDLLTTEGLRLLWPLPWRLQPSPLNSKSIVLNLCAWSIFLAGVINQAYDFIVQLS